MFWKILDRRPIKNTKIHKLNTTRRKQTTQNTAKQNYPGLVTFYDTRLGNEVGLFCNNNFWLHRCDDGECQFVLMSVYVVCVCLSARVCLSVCVSVCMCVCLSVCLSVSVFVAVWCGAVLQAALSRSLPASVRRYPRPITSRRSQHSAVLANDDGVSLGRGEELGRRQEGEGEGELGGGESCDAPAGQSDGLAEAHGHFSLNTEHSAHSGESADCRTATADPHCTYITSFSLSLHSVTHTTLSSHV